MFLSHIDLSLFLFLSLKPIKISLDENFKKEYKFGGGGITIFHGSIQRICGCPEAGHRGPILQVRIK